jgi:tripartite-type tricarboxylate transporter receptor subunit TctC
MTKRVLRRGMQRLAPLVVAACLLVTVKDPAMAARLVVAGAPGSTQDLVARAIASRLGDATGQPVTIDNRPGPIDGAAAETVARSVPDGSTLLLVTPAFAALTALQPNLPFDGVKAFAPIARIATEPLVLVATATMPTSSLQDLIAVAKANPGRINYASSGPGSVSHLAAELFKSVATVQLAHTPAKTTDAALSEVIAGRTKLLFANYGAVESALRSGKVKALAVTGPTRLALLPDVPTMREAGVFDYELVYWFGLAAPAATSKTLVERLNADVRKAVQADDVRDKLRTMLGAEPRVSTPEEFAALLARDVATFAKLARDMNLKLE